MIMLHCVPFPDAGAPAMIILGGGVDPAAASMAIASLRVAPLAAAAGTHVLPLTLPLAVPEVVGGGANAEAGRVEIEAAQSEGFALVGAPPNQLRVVVLPTGGTKAESVLVLAVVVAVAVAVVVAAPSAPPGRGAKATAVRHAARIVSRTMRPTVRVVARMRDGMVIRALD